MKIEKNMDIHLFQNTYFLKEELVNFARENDLQATGSKEELTKRIEEYLNTGVKLTNSTRTIRKQKINCITKEMRIESPFVCSEKHREFFRATIGPSFKFNVSFQKWLKENGGKTYQDAIKAYYDIQEYKKNHKTTIGKQFEYNTYIRDFFAANKDKNLNDAIKCWKYKKNLLGSNQYEDSDLSILTKERDQ